MWLLRYLGQLLGCFARWFASVLGVVARVLLGGLLGYSG